MNFFQIFLKHGMCLVNVIFFLFGLAVVIVSGVTLTREGEYESLLEDRFVAIPALLLTTGLLISFLFFFGCWGLFRKSYCLLITFACLLTVFLVMEVVLGIAAYVVRDDITPEWIQPIFNKTFQQSFSPDKHPNADTLTMWNTVQYDLECCGMVGPKDYLSLNGWHGNSSSFPCSCCSPAHRPCAPGNAVSQCDVTNVTHMSQTGCEVRVVAALQDIIAVAARWALLVAVLHLLWIMGACHFAVKFRQSTNYETMT